MNDLREYAAAAAEADASELYVSITEGGIAVEGPLHLALVLMLNRFYLKRLQAQREATTEQCVAAFLDDGSSYDIRAEGLAAAPQIPTEEDTP